MIHWWIFKAVMQNQILKTWTVPWKTVLYNCVSKRFLIWVDQPYDEGILLPLIDSPISKNKKLSFSPFPEEWKVSGNWNPSYVLKLLCTNVRTQAVNHPCQNAQAVKKIANSSGDGRWKLKKTFRLDRREYQDSTVITNLNKIENICHTWFLEAI